MSWSFRTELAYLKSFSGEEVEFNIPANYFEDMFAEDYDVTITVLARVLHSDERFYTQQVLTLLKPTFFISRVQFFAVPNLTAFKNLNLDLSA